MNHNHSVEAQGYIIVSYLEGGGENTETHRFAIQSNWTLKCTEGWFVSVIFNIHTYTRVCISKRICTRTDRATERPFEMTRTYWEAWESSCTRLSLKIKQRDKRVVVVEEQQFHSFVCRRNDSNLYVCQWSQRCTPDKSADNLQEVLLGQWWTDLVHQEPPTDTRRAVHDFTSQRKHQLTHLVDHELAML